MARTAAGALPGAAPRSKSKSKSNKPSAAKMLERMRRRAKIDKDKAKAVGSSALDVATVQGTATAAGLAAGYFGDNFKAMGIDLALLIGAGVTGFGLVQTYQGKKSAQHFVNAGSGCLAAGMANLGRQWGETLRQDGFEALFGGLFGGQQQVQAPPQRPALPPRRAVVTPQGYPQRAMHPGLAPRR